MSTKASLSAIVACSKNRVIGKDNQLPWHLPEDLKFFRDKTKGHIIIMGRKTYDSIGKPLPGRFHIVISRQATTIYSHPMVKVVSTIDQAVTEAQKLIPQYPSEIFVVGGGEIYKQSLPRLDRVYLTSIDAVVEGDAFFPELPLSDWKLVEERRVAGNPSFAFQTWEPKTSR